MTSAPMQSKKKLQLELFQVTSKLVTEARPFQSELYCSLQESQLVPGVIAGAFVHVGIHRLLFEHLANAIGQLHFSACAAFSSFGPTEDLGRRMVAAVVGRFDGRFLRWGFST